MSSRVLVLGTRNEKKKRELSLLLEKTGISTATLDAYPNSVEVEETGTTFEENARLKATEQATAIGQWVLGEDSGLCVEALEGAPGVYSARYAGENCTDEDNNRKLLADLGTTPLEKRAAYYVCHLSLSDPDGTIHLDCECYCKGRILETAHGRGGFGYDPLFELPEYHQTFGQLGDSVKSVLSHRARAMRRFLPAVERLIQEGKWA